MYFILKNRKSDIKLSTNYNTSICMFCPTPPRRRRQLPALTSRPLDEVVSAASAASAASAVSALSPRLGTSIRHIQGYVSGLFIIRWWPLGRVAKKAATNSIEPPHKRRRCLFQAGNRARRQRKSLCLPVCLLVSPLKYGRSENCGDVGCGACSARHRKSFSRLPESVG